MINQQRHSQTTSLRLKNVHCNEYIQMEKSIEEGADRSMKKVIHTNRKLSLSPDFSEDFSVFCNAFPTLIFIVHIICILQMSVNYYCYFFYSLLF